MLYRIITPSHFSACLEHVRKAYWPEGAYQAKSTALHPGWPVGTHDADKIKELNEQLERVVEEVALDENHWYQPLGEDGTLRPPLPFPFLDRFHKLFVKRQWTQPYANPRAHADELFRLCRDGAGGNYSKSEGNFHHFVNVVAALARLVMYFSDVERLHHVFASRFDSREREFRALAFAETPTLRSFILMLAGFLHDLGKTVDDPRHAMEGAIILGYHTTKARHQLHKIVRAYHAEYRFEREDLMYVACLVSFHDHYGTLGTGEDGYMALVNMIDRFKRYSLKHAKGKEGQMAVTRQCLFDLWLLNVADIMVSLDRKWVPQEEWLDAEKARRRIGAFLTGSKGSCLVHDLKVTFRLLDALHDRRHADDLTRLAEEAHDCSKRHVIERLQRLAVSTLFGPIGASLNGYQKKPPATPEAKRHEAVLEQLQQLGDAEWHAIIVRNIQAVCDRGEFVSRLSWIGRMDYALGFFQDLAAAALRKVLDELRGQTRTGWLRSDADAGDIDDEGYYVQAQAEFFADNMVAIVVGMLAYVLFREPSIDRLRNIEFSDARRRLAEHKRDQLLALEGPFRARRAAEAIMQTIYFY